MSGGVRLLCFRAYETSPCVDLKSSGIHRLLTCLDLESNGVCRPSACLDSKSTGVRRPSACLDSKSSGGRRPSACLDSKSSGVRRLPACLDLKSSRFAGRWRASIRNRAASPTVGVPRFQNRAAPHAVSSFVAISRISDQTSAAHTAIAAMPSSRPGNPKRSFVVALTPT